MNKQLNIKTRLFSPSFMTLSVGIVVVLAMMAWGGSSAQAQTQAAPPDSGAAPADTAVTPAGVVDSSITIQAKGTVNDPSGPIPFNGIVNVSCRRVVDTTSATTPTLMMLDFDFSQLTGSTGSLKTLKTYVTGGNHASEIRPLQATDTVVVTTPYFDSAKDGLSARTMLITATLNFDIGTGKLTSGTISLGDNVVTRSTVGTVAPAQ